MKVVITGISGQDGALLAKRLLEKGYEVLVLCEGAVYQTLQN